MRIHVVIEKANGNYSTYSPDLLGCIATGKTIEEVKKSMEEAVKLHIEGLVEDKLLVSGSEIYLEYI